MEEQIEELEALKSIFEEELAEISRFPVCFMVKLDLKQDIQISGAIQLKFTLPDDYPSVSPHIEVPMRSGALTASQCSQLLHHLKQVADENIGMAVVFTLIDVAQQWISDNVTLGTAGEAPEMEEEAILSEDFEKIQMAEPKVTGGRWDYVIGIVGKPSAGKSTFFNACTTLDLAKTGAHPFTTIEPNIGKAFYSIPCPCSTMESRCQAAHGHDYAGNRHIPVLLKDVAGLVPGAWEGKGRGNRFLNDLLDADVLIHIIDVSGTTNEKGEETMDYDPASDVHWLQEELHQWIFQNVWSRWDSIVKRPKKLIDMFTGYHANRSTIFAAIRNAGIGERELAFIASWDEKMLHKVVGEFLNIRFPMLLVLNKADLPSSVNNINRLQTQFSNYSTRPVSARSECQLQQLVKDQVISYDHGNNCFQRTSLPCEDTVCDRLEYIKKHVLDVYQSTNCHQALCQAVKLRSPVFAFPVQCLDTLKSIRRGQQPSHLDNEVLRDCIPLKPWSTVEDLYNVMLNCPIKLHKGDFVRAETVDKMGKKKPVKKDEVIDSSNCVIHIMTNKRTGQS